MTKLYIENEDNDNNHIEYINNMNNMNNMNTMNEYDIDEGPYYNPYEHKTLYIDGNTNSTNMDDNNIYFNIIAPLPLFILSVCSVYGLCYLFHKIKSLSKNNNSLRENINIDSLNTLVVCDELPENNCSICLDEFKNEDILKKLNCNHIFHKDCLEPWINNNNLNCPLCRREFF